MRWFKEWLGEHRGRERWRVTIGPTTLVLWATESGLEILEERGTVHRVWLEASAEGSLVISLSELNIADALATAAARADQLTPEKCHELGCPNRRMVDGPRCWPHERSVLLDGLRRRIMPGG